MEITNFWAKLDFYIESFLGCQKCQRNNVSQFYYSINGPNLSLKNLEFLHDHFNQTYSTEMLAHLNTIVPFYTHAPLIGITSPRKESFQENPECRRRYSKDTFLIGGNSGSIGDINTHRKNKSKKAKYKYSHHGASEINQTHPWIICIYRACIYFLYIVNIF